MIASAQTVYGPPVKPNSSKIVAVLDPGTAKVACLIARLGVENSTGIEVLGWSVHRSAGIKGGAVVDTQKAARALGSVLRRAEAAAGCSVNQVAVPVGCGRVRSQIFAVEHELGGRVCDRDVSAEIAAKVRAQLSANGRSVLHLVPMSYEVDGGDLQTENPEAAGQSIRVVFHAVVADTGPVATLLDTVRECDVAPSMVACTAFTSASSVLTPEEADEGTVCIDLGAGTSSLAMFASGKIIYADSLSVGGNNVTQDIARNLKVPFEEAERLKLEMSMDESDAGGPDFNDRLRGIIWPRIQEIFSSLNERQTANGLPSLSESRVVLTGGGSHLADLPRMVQAILPGCVLECRNPDRFPGFTEFSCGASFASPHGVLQLKLAQFVEQSEAVQGAMSGGNGAKQYINRIGRWFLDSF